MEALTGVGGFHSLQYICGRLLVRKDPSSGASITAVEVGQRTKRGSLPMDQLGDSERKGACGKGALDNMAEIIITFSILLPRPLIENSL